jgi:hypothetical protein
MRDSTDTIDRDDSPRGDADVPAGPLAAPSSRRVVGVVRVLRGRLAAPCRCCSDAAARFRHDEDPLVQS